MSATIPFTALPVSMRAAVLANQSNEDAIRGMFYHGWVGQDDPYYPYWHFENCYVSVRVWQGGNCRNCAVLTDEPREPDSNGNTFVVVQP